MLTFKNLGDMGALGNQMFQYASLRGIAEKSNNTWKIPRPGSTTIYYNLFDIFKMESVTEDNFINNEKFPTIKAKGFNFDPSLFKLKGNYNLNDYLQTEKYFEHIQEDILKDFTFKNAPNINDEYIFIHVRRTDYVKLPNHHPPCTLDYYMKGLEYFPKHLPVKIFSDDLAWCRKNFVGDRFIIKEENKYYPEQLFLKGPREYTWYPTPYEDFYEMTQAVGGIIANSSYSWWGAYLMKNKYPIIAPAKWFGPALPHNTCDLIPSEWKLL